MVRTVEAAPGPLKPALLAARVRVVGRRRLGEGQRTSAGDQLDVVDLGVAGVVAGVKRPVEAEPGELGPADLSGAGPQQAVDTDVLGLALRVGVVGEAADGDA